jgi:hypothetical protein
MKRIQRCLGVLAGLSGALFALAAAAPAALASLAPPDPGPAGAASAPVIRTAVVGGMPGWQIALTRPGPRCWPPSWRCWPTGPGQRGGR